MDTRKKLYEIQIPVAPNLPEVFICDKNGNFNQEYHDRFLAKVLTVANGYTALPIVEGAWINGSGKTFIEKMIPVRIFCTDENITEIASFAKRHYDQEAIFVVELGTAIFF